MAGCTSGLGDNRYHSGLKCRHCSPSWSTRCLHLTGKCPSQHIQKLQGQSTRALIPIPIVVSSSQFPFYYFGSDSSHFPLLPFSLQSPNFSSSMILSTVSPWRAVVHAGFPGASQRMSCQTNTAPEIPLLFRLSPAMPPLVM